MELNEKPDILYFVLLDLDFINLSTFNWRP
jgi:hypothetical protein